MGSVVGDMGNLDHAEALCCCMVAVGIGGDVPGESALGDSSQPRPGWAWSMKYEDCRGPP